MLQHPAQEERPTAPRAAHTVRRYARQTQLADLHERSNVLMVPVPEHGAAGLMPIHCDTCGTFVASIEATLARVAPTAVRCEGCSFPAFTPAGPSPRRA